jgi:selenocysteine-specific elongation factor
VVDLGAPGLAQLRLEAPLIARAGDRAVLRRIAPAATIGGALVLDPDPRRHAGGRDAERLETIRSGDVTAVLELLLEERHGGVPADPAAWAADPLLCFPLARLGAPALAEEVAVRMADADIRSEAGSLVRAEEDRTEQPADPARAPAAEGASRRILELLAADGFEPRAPQAIADAIGVERAEAIAILGGLVQAGLVVQVKPDVYYPAEQLERIETIVGQLAARRGSISIGELRDDLRTSRKYSQAILEHLDGRGLTVRQGDRHVARSAVRR